MDQNKVKFGIIGFGKFGEKRLIPGFKDASYAELLALSKRDIEKAAGKAKQFGVPHVYNDPNELLKNPEIDAVFIASPNGLHKEHAIAAAKAGKHIIVEKPMAINTNECRIMAEAARNAGVSLMVAQCMRYNSTVLAIKRKIEQGIVGDLVSLECNFFYDASTSERVWRYDKQLAGGGPLMDLAVHCIDNLRFLSGREVVSVKGLKQFKIVPEVESKAHVILDLGNDLLGSVRVGFEGNYYTSLDVVGTKGIVRAEMFNLINTDVKLRQWQNQKYTAEIIHNANCYAAEIDAFATSLIKKQPSPIPAEEGIKNQLVLDELLNKN